MTSTSLTLIRKISLKKGICYSLTITVARVWWGEASALPRHWPVLVSVCSKKPRLDAQ